MQLVRRLRLPAVVCALAVLICELIARPYSTMGFVDDWPYILSAQTLAATGHIVYNGWAAPILGWQLYVGAAFIKLFGYSLTTVRMSTLLLSMILACFLQRILVRCSLSERNATLGTLVLVLSPLYLMLSVTFMTDISGLLSLVLCLYGCLRALQAATSRAAIAWLSFAVAANALCGTSRQIEWLGVLVMVPSALWLLRDRRSVLYAGLAANFAGVLFILGCMRWFARQPYTIPEHLLVATFPVAQTAWQILHMLLDLPFLLLPIVAVFPLALRRNRPRVIAILCACIAAYLFLATYPSHLRGNFPLEPTMNDWINVHGIFEFVFMKGTPAIFIPQGLQVLFTVAAFAGLLSLIALLLDRGPSSPPAACSAPSTGVSWKQLGILVAPFALANILIVIPRAATYGLTERYVLGLLIALLPCVVRCFQDRVQPRLPLLSVVLVLLTAVCSILLVHNLFSFYRARVALVDELRADGVPETSVDNGWEYNVDVELQHAPYINNPRIELPANAFVPPPPPPAGHCRMNFAEAFPHIRPLYGVSFSPDACYGPAPFAPVHYARWPYRTPGTLYVVRYTAASGR